MNNTNKKAKNLPDHPGLTGDTWSKKNKRIPFSTYPCWPNPLDNLPADNPIIKENRD